MKGETIIELTDVNTGEVEVIREENMVTNVLADFLSTNIEGMMYKIYEQYYDTLTGLRNTMFPICPNAIGGILLFSENLEENADNYYAPSNNQCIGYASNDVNNTSNTMRGSLNLNESGSIDGGYKFVWDFTTSQANGTIAAVGLTHKNAGVCYMGDRYNIANKLICLSTKYTSVSGVTYKLFSNMVEIRGDYLYSIELTTNKEIHLFKVRRSFMSVGLKDTLLEDRVIIEEDNFISSTEFVEKACKGNDTSYFDFIDGKNGYWYGFTGSNYTDGSRIYYIKISKEDYSSEEGNFFINNLNFYNTSYRPYSSNIEGYRRRLGIAVRDEYLYLMGKDRSFVIKININNTADILKIQLGFTSAFGEVMSSDRMDGVNMTQLNDWIICSDFMISSDDKIYKTTNSRVEGHMATPPYRVGPYLLTYTGEIGNGNVRVYKDLYLLTPYLATINNLSTAVVKTADRTMKITYILTES